MAQAAIFKIYRSNVKLSIAFLLLEIIITSHKLQQEKKSNVNFNIKQVSTRYDLIFLMTVVNNHAIENHSDLDYMTLCMSTY